MGSGTSRSSGVKVTRIAEFKNGENVTEEETATAAGIPLVDCRAIKQTDTSTADNETAAQANESSDSLSKSSAKYSLDVRAALAEIEAERRDVIDVHRSRQLPTQVTPIHYVEKNEGGMLVEDVDESNADILPLKQIIEKKDELDSNEAESKSSFRAFIASVPEKRWMTPKEPTQSRHSLPDGEPGALIEPKLTPVHGTGAMRLGVSGRALIHQLQNQGIITAEAARYTDSSSHTILGELTHLGLIRDGEDEEHGNMVYDDGNRRKIPARLSKLQQQQSDIQQANFPNPEEKRRKIRTRSHALGCGFQLNEDVVSNALQRASVRERNFTTFIDKQKVKESKELMDKISSVELL